MAVSILRTKDGKLDALDRQLLSELATRLAEGDRKILLHLHGGLVSESAGMAAANRLSGKGPNTFNAPDDWEQVYIVWRTGAIETLRTNWQDLFDNDRLYRTLLKRLISFISGRISLPVIDGRAVAAGDRLSPAEVERRLLSGSDHPFADLDAPRAGAADDTRAFDDENLADFDNDLTRELRRDGDLQTVAADVEAALTPPDVTVRAFDSGDALAGGRVVYHIDDSVAGEWQVRTAEGRSLLGLSVLESLVKHGLAIGKRVIKRYRNGRDHGLHATVVEEIVRELYGDLIGSIIWGMMKDDAGDHFEDGALGAELLKALAANTGGRLLVTGHSAGSIWASELLLAMSRVGLMISADVVFLAPAVRTSKFAAALDASSASIQRFRLFAMHDDLERQDVLLGPGYGFLYPSSLLYFVSGLCEESDAKGLEDAPLLGMERFVASPTSWLEDVDEGPKLQQVRDFLNQGGDRVVLSVSAAGAGRNSDAKSHGSFDDNPATLASVATFFA
jgi:hypothetical protein